MRLHRLTATAFGPFAGTIEVDFDALGSAGVFLLSGPTGAGKSSVLDAICFALYGQVPGDRAAAKHLHSDHAPRDREPRVALELSIGTRRFRFTRSPAWERPKRRGQGTTKVPAHVVVEEFRDAAWIGLTNRLDDAGLLVADLLGMTATQFTQVAMLPQGRFQAFLRASSTERQAVLQQLFRTDRFERVERWLADERTRTRRASEVAGEEAIRLLARTQEAVGVGQTGQPEPAEPLGGAAGAIDADAVLAWTERAVREAASRARKADAAEAAAISAAAAAGEELERAREIAGHRRRGHQAQRRLQELEADRPRRDADRELLEAHARAAPLVGPIERAEQHARAARDAETRATELGRALGAERAPGELDVPLTLEEIEDWRALEQAAHTEIASFAPRETELGQVRARVGEIDAALGRLRAEEESSAARAGALPDLISEAEESLGQLRAAAGEVEAARSALAHLRELGAVANRKTRLNAELEAARLELQRATGTALEAKEAYLTAREARINGMAAEIAGSLASGCSCPVCGSADHPAPARPAGPSIGRAEEDAARRAADDAGLIEQTAAERVRALDTDLQAASARLGEQDTASLAARSAEAAALVEEREASARRVEPSQARLAALREEAASLAARTEASRIQRAQLGAELAARTERLAALEAERAAVLRGVADTLAEALESQQARLSRLDAAAASLRHSRQAGRAAEDSQDAVHAGLAAAGFADTAAALAAVLEDERRRQVQRRLRDADASLAAARAVLAEEVVAAALAAPEPDLDGLADARTRAEGTARENAADAAAARARESRLSDLAGQLGDALRAWQPLREQHLLAAELAALAEGRSADNPLRMRLSAYVLTERLRLVIAAANERLARMTEQRFALQHALDRGAGEQRGGLSLRIRDEWTGIERDPATLSGGETFVVSLALALGLADTVAHEAGGVDIDTIFIDEGFGSLDADTLEDVMDTLDGLRDGGRVVGLISHVPEMRARITTQLELIKGRDGSTARPVLATR